MIQHSDPAEGDHDHGKTEAGGQIAHRFGTSQRRLPTPYPFHDRAGKLPQEGPHPRCHFLEIQRPALFFYGNRWSRWTAKEKWIDCRKRHFGSRRRLQTESIILRARRNRLEPDGPPTQSPPGFQERSAADGLADVGVRAGKEKMESFFRLQISRCSVSLLDPSGRRREVIILKSKTKRKKIWQISPIGIRTTFSENTT